MATQTMASLRIASSTSGYESIRHIWSEQPRNLPLFGFDIIRLMMFDSAVRLALSTRAAPLASAEFAYKSGVDPMGNPMWTPGVQAQREEVGHFVHRQLLRIWTNHIDEICQAQIWGWSAGEVTLRLSQHNLVEIDRLEPRQAADCRVLLAGGDPVGVRIDRVKNVGKVDLRFPNAWFHAHDPEPGQHYGRSTLLGAYSPWADKCLDGGALDVRRLFMHKDAYGGVDLGYPEGSTFIDGQESVPNRDIARQIAEQLVSGGVTTRPSTRDENGNEKWPLTRATVPANPQHILQYPKDLDGEIRRGTGIPDDVIDSEGSGGWAGKRVPLMAFYASLDGWLRRIVTDFDEQTIRCLVRMNFGRDEEYEITTKPLAEQAMEQQSNAGEGGGNGGSGDTDWQPHTTRGGGQGWISNGDRVVSGAQSPKKMSLDTVAIVEASRKLVAAGEDQADA